MRYIKIAWSNGGEAYQEINEFGHMVRFVDADRNPVEPQSTSYSVVGDGSGALPLWTGAEFNEFDPPVDKSLLLQLAADARWRREMRGATWNDIYVPTDDRAKLLIMGATSALADDASAPFASGTTVTMLTGAQFKVMYGVIVGHVQGCFALFATVAAQIESGAIVTAGQVEEAFRA